MIILGGGCVQYIKYTSTENGLWGGNLFKSISKFNDKDYICFHGFYKVEDSIFQDLGTSVVITHHSNINLEHCEPSKHSIKDIFYKREGWCQVWISGFYLCLFFLRYPIIGEVIVYTNIVSYDVINAIYVFHAL